ncbi:MAG: transcriptional regulator [Actinomycetota bacterium]|nr:transcriptional regulator [Actinomycetota bacterium]
MESFEHSLEAVGMLADDLRRHMFLFIREAGRPVGRDEAAEEAGISRKLAAFHLDRLVEKGLLKAHYVRLSGRRGPGAGRPSKVYEPTETEMAVSIPSRSYDVVGKLLLRALEDQGRGRFARESVRRAAREEGRELGEQVRRDKRLRSPGARKVLDVAREVLYDRGYEPYRDERGALRLRNCPFHTLAQQSAELVCGMNEAFIGGFLEGLGSKSVSAQLDPRSGQCCVRIDAGEAVA